MKWSKYLYKTIYRYYSSFRQQLHVFDHLVYRTGELTIHVYRKLWRPLCMYLVQLRKKRVKYTHYMPGGGGTDSLRLGNQVQNYSPPFVAIDSPWLCLLYIYSPLFLQPSKSTLIVLIIVFFISLHLTSLNYFPGRHYKQIYTFI